MMKKMLALLLAMLLLPFAALADASRFDVEITVDEEKMATIFANSGMFADAENEEKLCAAMAKLMNLGFSVIMQDDAAYMELNMADTSVLDLSVLMGGNDLIIASSLMGSDALSFPMALLNVENDEFMQLMANTDWEKLLGGMVMAAMQSLQGVESNRMRGSFSGDAFTGGVYCTTYTFDDADIAAIIDALLTDDCRALILACAEYWETDGAAFLADVDEKNAQVAEANAHRYIVRLVEDENNVLIGIAATVMQGNKQLGTLSVGFEEDSVTFVIGFALEEENYWHAQEITFTEKTDESGAVTMTFSGTLLEFTAPKTDDYAYAHVNSAKVKMNTIWSLDVTTQNSATAWNLTANQKLGYGSTVQSVKAQGLYIPGVRFVNVSDYSMNGDQYMTEKMTWAPCDPIDSTGEGLTLHNLLNTDEETLTKIGMSFGMELAKRMMNAIPMELIFYFSK